MDTSTGFIIDFVLCLFPKRGSGGMQKVLGQYLSFPSSNMQLCLCNLELSGSIDL